MDIRAANNLTVQETAIGDAGRITGMFRRRAKEPHYAENFPFPGIPERE